LTNLKKKKKKKKKKSENQENQSILSEWLDDDMIKKLLESGISAAKDNDKVFIKLLFK